MISIRRLTRFKHSDASAIEYTRVADYLQNMPKDPAASRQLRLQRIAKAKGRQALMDKPSGSVSLNVLGNGGPGNPAALMLITEHRRYLFNCGEGTQRLAVAHGIPVKVQGDGKKIKLSSETCAAGDDVVMCFICKLPPLPGALQIDKCFELKVPKGPALAQLKSGKDYVFPDGRVVKSGDVVAPEDPGPVFLVVDCPSDDFVPSLTSNASIARHQKSTEPDVMPGFVFHFSPPEVISDNRYQKWMSGFPESTIHVGLNETNCSTAFTPSAEFIAKLRFLDDEIFPVLYSSVNADVQQTGAIVPAATLLKTGLRPANESAKLDSGCVAKDTSECVVEQMDENEAFVAAIRDYKEKVSKIGDRLTEASGDVRSPDVNEDSIYPVITFLGTASAAPSTLRNTACIHVAADPNHTFIFDCAEGAYGQLFRLFGPDNIENELRKIGAIFISHLHADHHLGLIHLLKKRSQVTDEKVTLFLPQAVHNWLCDYSREYEPLMHLFDCIQNENMLSFENYDGKLMKKLNLSNVQTARVKHCRDSFGITITTKEKPFKIVYSGDAMPSPLLAVAGRDCDVLIHEATMEDDLQDEALIKRHSTTAQAISMGDMMKAKHIVLTHFSQRYAVIPMMDPQLLEQRSVTCAYDYMRLRRCDYHRAAHLFRPLAVCFSEYTSRHLQRMENLKTRQEKIKNMGL